MRAIKFRGFDGQDWIEGDLIHTEKGNINIMSRGSQYQVIPESVGQFTEKHDVNGVEIFEGHLCRYKGGKVVYVIRMNVEHGCYELYYNGTHGMFFVDIQEFNNIEVFANAIERPELLKGATNG